MFEKLKKIFSRQDLGKERRDLLEDMKNARENGDMELYNKLEHALIDIDKQLLERWHNVGSTLKGVGMFMLGGFAISKAYEVDKGDEAPKNREVKRLADKSFRLF